MFHKLFLKRVCLPIPHPARPGNLRLVSSVFLGLCSTSWAGIIDTGPAYTRDPMSPALGTMIGPGAFVTGTPNDDDTLGKGPNFFGATTLTINGFGPNYIVIREVDSNAQPPGVGNNGGTPLTTGYWLPLTIANNTGLAWSGVSFKLGFGYPSAGLNFVQYASLDNLDFNFPTMPGGGLGLAPTYTPVSSAFQGPAGNTTALQPTYPNPLGHTILWQNGTIQPGGGNTLQWKLDVPNSADILANDAVPQSLFTTDAGGQIIGYTFTLAVEPFAVPEPSPVLLELFALALVLLKRRPA